MIIQWRIGFRFLDFTIDKPGWSDLTPNQHCSRREPCLLVWQASSRLALHHYLQRGEIIHRFINKRFVRCLWSDFSCCMVVSASVITYYLHISCNEDIALVAILLRTFNTSCRLVRIMGVYYFTLHVNADFMYELECTAKLLPSRKAVKPVQSNFRFK